MESYSSSITVRKNVQFSVAEHLEGFRSFLQSTDREYLLDALMWSSRVVQTMDGPMFWMKVDVSNLGADDEAKELYLAMLDYSVHRDVTPFRSVPQRELAHILFRELSWYGINHGTWAADYTKDNRLRFATDYERHFRPCTGSQWSKFVRNLIASSPIAQN